MPGLEFIEKVISRNPMMNCAVVSSLSPVDYHKASEGLGILMQLPVKPGQKEAEMLIGWLKTILSLSERAEYNMNK